MEFNKSYADAIQLIADGNVDFRGIGILVAKHYPDIFTQLVEFQVAGQFKPWMLELWNNIPDFIENRVAFIKGIRDHADLGLFESKNLSDYVMMKLGFSFHSAPTGIPSLSRPLMVLANQLILAHAASGPHVRRV